MNRAFLAARILPVLLCGLVFGNLGAAAPWPASDSGWTALSYPVSPGVGFDAVGDQNPATVDLVGGTLNSLIYPLAYYALDQGHLMFRMRVNGTTANPQSVWQVFFNTDTDSPGELFDYALELKLSSNPKEVLFAVVDQTTQPVLSAVQVDVSNILWTGVTGDYSRYFLLADSNFGGDADYFVDIAMPLGPLYPLLGASRQLQVGITTSTSHSVINKDYSLDLEGTSQVSDILTDAINVPEPAHLAMAVSMALLGLACVRRSRRA